jgi:hypothetical protein
MTITINGTGIIAGLTAVSEVATTSATASTGTINCDVSSQSVLYYTTAATGNFTLNFRASSTVTLDSLMATGTCISATFMCTNTGTAYYASAITIDGASVTPKWQNGTAPSAGNTNSIDTYTFAIIKTGSNAFVVLASQTKFA